MINSLKDLILHLELTDGKLEDPQAMWCTIKITKGWYNYLVNCLQGHTWPICYNLSTQRRCIMPEEASAANPKLNVFITQAQDQHLYISRRWPPIYIKLIT